MSISIAKATQTSQSSLSSSKISNQANAYAMSEADLLKSVDYSDLTSEGKSAISGSDFTKEISVSAESNYTDSIKQRTATINVYKGSETTPRASLKVTRYSVEKQESSGVPIGTVIAWPGSKAPTTAGTWLECNGQSCAGYSTLVSVLGKNTVPDYRNRFLEGSTSPNKVIEAGLPNITGKFAIDYWACGNFTAIGPFVLNTFQGRSRCRDGLASGDFSYMSFDASRSNAIYGRSNTVQPPATTVRWLIKAA